MINSRRSCFQRSVKFVLPAIVSVLLFAGCVSASKMLDRAEAAWVAGAYDGAILQALSSYETAVDRNKDPDEISAAKNFLVDRFPQANENLLASAEKQLSGTDTEKAAAWQTYQALVNMNRRVKDSIASSFLETEDYTAELQKAKETAAQIKYVKALELMGRNSRSSYIEAAALLREIDSFVPDYRDIRVLIDTCIDAGTLVVAFSDRDIYFSVTRGSIPDVAGVGTEVRSTLRRFIETNDNPEFLKFITAGSVQASRDAGAVLFVEVQGEIRASAETVDRYLQEGSITWKRSYSGTPALLVTRISDMKTEVVAASVSLDQDVKIEFFPKKFSTTSLTAEMYNNQFNNPLWMSNQLSSAKNALSEAGGSAGMIVWAEMQYGGVAAFLTAATVAGAEGPQSLPIDAAVYSDTQNFINQTLPAFLGFQDMKLRDRLVKEIADQFLGNATAKDLLGELEG